MGRRFTDANAFAPKNGRQLAKLACQVSNTHCDPDWISGIHGRDGIWWVRNLNLLTVECNCLVCVRLPSHMHAEMSKTVLPQTDHRRAAQLRERLFERINYIAWKL